MILIEKPQHKSRLCTICCDSAYRTITFRSDYNNQGHEIALCRKCFFNLEILCKEDIAGGDPMELQQILYDRERR